MKVSNVVHSPITKLAGYFFALAVLLGAITWVMPWFGRLLIPEMPGSEAFPSLTSDIGGPSRAMIASVVETVLLGLLALVGALVVAVPVVWTYTVIMRQEGYDRAFVRMLTALPLVVAGVVQVVQGDLAIAFALAGIVAAVRFRTTVKDLENAVFAFAAIGIGLAAGTGSFTLAAAISAAFSLLAIVLWKLNIGAVEPSLGLSHGGIALSEALVPGESHRAVRVGDADGVRPVEATELRDLQDSIDHLSDYIRADALRKKRKYDTLIVAYSHDEAEAKKHMKAVLDEHTSRSVHVDTIERDDGALALEYLVRLKKKVSVGLMIKDLDCGAGKVLTAAELKPVKGLRKRLT